MFPSWETTCCVVCISLHFSFFISPRRFKKMPVFFTIIPLDSTRVPGMQQVSIHLIFLKGMSKLSIYGTHKVTPWVKGGTVASFCVSRLISHQLLPGEGESRLNENKPLGFAARTGQQAPVLFIFHPCWSSYSEWNPGHTLNWNGGEGGRALASIIFNYRSAFVCFWWAARVDNHQAASFLGIGLASPSSRSCLRWKEEWVKGERASRPDLPWGPGQSIWLWTELCPQQ